MSALPNDNFRALLQEVLAAYESLAAQLASSQALQRRPEHLHRQHSMEVSPQSSDLPGMLGDPEPHSITKQADSSLEFAGGRPAIPTVDMRLDSHSPPPMHTKRPPALASVVPMSPRQQAISGNFSQEDRSISPTSDDVVVRHHSFVENLPANCATEKIGTALPNPKHLKSHVQRMSEDIKLEKSRTVSGIMSMVGRAEFGDKGFIARVAKSKCFETFTLLVVILNGIWIAIDADFNDAIFILDADPVFQVMEHFFCTIFTGELVIRMLAFKSKRAALRDPWFAFDAILVSLMILETWVMIFVTLATDKGKLGVNISILRLLRLARLFRVSRVVRAVPELSFMVKGVLEATRGVACTLILLLGVLYVFGIALRQLSDKTEMGKKYFSNVPHAMFTLFAQCTLLDGITGLFIQVYEESLVCTLLVVMVVDVAALTLMNMLVGVLCEVMCLVAHSEKEQMAMSTLKEQILKVLEELDQDKDRLISKDDFLHMVCSLKATAALQGIGVDVVSLVDYADYFFQSDKHGEEFEEKWSFDHFIEEIMRVRGVNAATVRDITDLRKLIHSQYTSRNAMIRQIQEHVATLAKNQGKLERLLLQGTPSKMQGTPSKKNQLNALMGSSLSLPPSV